MDVENNEVNEQQQINDDKGDKVCLKSDEAVLAEEMNKTTDKVEKIDDENNVDSASTENKDDQDTSCDKNDAKVSESVENNANQDAKEMKITAMVSKEDQSEDVTMDEVKDSMTCRENKIEAETMKQNVESVNKNSVEEKSKSDNYSDKKIADLFFIDKRTPLEVIAMQYDSSDDEKEKDGDDKNAVNKDVSNAQDYRNKDEVVLSSDESSDSESDSSSSSSDSDSVKVSSGSSDDSSDESSSKRNSNKKGNRGKKNQQLEGEYCDLPPIEDLQISVPEVLCEPLGKVAWTVDQMVVVTPEAGKPTLNLDTVLFIERGQRALGHIFDVFGQVTEPHYCVRFNSSNHIQERDIKVGMTVYFCPNTPYTSLVFLSELKKMKPVDDLEDDDPPQFSDDEEEQAYLKSLKNKSNTGKANQTQQEGQGEAPKKRQRANRQQGWQSNHPWNSYRENQQLQQQMATRPFYRTHHPWSRPRYPQVNNQLWYQQQQPQPHPQQQFVPYQQANWGYRQAYGNVQQQTYQARPQNYAQQQQIANQQVDPSSFAQVQQQQPIVSDELSRLISQYPLVPPPPPPSSSDQSK